MIEEIVKKESKVKIFPLGRESGILSDSETQNAGRGIVRNFSSDSEIEIEMEREYPLKKKVCYVMYILSCEKVYLTYVNYRSSFAEEGKVIVSLEIISPMERVQRRMHERVSCHAKIFFKQVSSESIAAGKTQRNEEMDIPEYEDSMVDISGGGIRFTTKRQIKLNDHLRVAFEIEQDNKTVTMSALGQVVYAGKLRNEQDFYDIRMKYVGLSEKAREQIIQYVFQLERND